MAIHAAIVPNISPSERAHISNNVPLPFPLQKLEARGSRLMDGSGPNAARPGRDAAESLHTGGVGTIVGRQVIPLLDKAVTVARHHPVGGG